MNYFLFVGYPLLVVAGLETVPALTLLRQNSHNSPVNKSIAHFSFASAGHSVFSALMYVRVGSGFSDIDFYARAIEKDMSWQTLASKLRRQGSGLIARTALRIADYGVGAGDHPGPGRGLVSMKSITI